ncbi:MAG: hypothetical protein RLZZ542_669 [Pseudomonadota bacterium]
MGFSTVLGPDAPSKGVPDPVVESAGVTGRLSDQ